MTGAYVFRLRTLGPETQDAEGLFGQMASDDLGKPSQDRCDVPFARCGNFLDRLPHGFPRFAAITPSREPC